MANRSSRRLQFEIWYSNISHHFTRWYCRNHHKAHTKMTHYTLKLEMIERIFGGTGSTWRKWCNISTGHEKPIFNLCILEEFWGSTKTFRKCLWTFQILFGHSHSFPQIFPWHSTLWNCGKNFLVFSSLEFSSPFIQ